MYEYFKGVPEITVPDNLRSGVKDPCRYDPEINRSYQDLAEHYGTCIIPARVRKPKDKAKAEQGVQLVQRWILAVLRNQVFYSLSELNQAIWKCLEKLNSRKMKIIGKSRRELFEYLDRPALKALPLTAYEYTEWKKAGVNIDYHFIYDKHFYSVPYQLVREKIWVRASVQVVEAYSKGKRVASHVRSFKKGSYTTQKEHMPKSHREYLEWSPSRIKNWALKIGPAAQQVIEEILSQPIHPEQGYRSSLGVIRLGKKYGDDRLEKACEKALRLKSPKYRTIKTMLKNKMEKIPLEQSDESLNKKTSKQLSLLETQNIRGKNYYH